MIRKFRELLEKNWLIDILFTAVLFFFISWAFELRHEAADRERIESLLITAGIFSLIYTSVMRAVRYKPKK